MTATAYDSHQYVKTIEASGVPKEQAESMNTGLSKVIDSTLVSKSELKDVEAELNGQIKDVKHDLSHLSQKVDSLNEKMDFIINTMPSRTAIKVVAYTGALIGLLGGLSKLFGII